jgi:hypothetical protein
MQHDELFHVLVFAGCAALGFLGFRRMAQAVMVIVVGFVLYAVVVHASGSDGHMVEEVLRRGLFMLNVVFETAERVVGKSGVLGFVVGFMAGLFRWKTRRDQDRGVVRFPTYPTPD